MVSLYLASIVLYCCFIGSEVILIAKVANCVEKTAGGVRTPFWPI